MSKIRINLSSSIIINCAFSFRYFISEVLSIYSSAIMLCTLKISTDYALVSTDTERTLSDLDLDSFVDTVSNFT